MDRSPGMSGKERIQRLVLRIVLRALGPMLNRAAKRHPPFRAQLARHDAVIQIQLRDGTHLPAFHRGRRQGAFARRHGRAAATW